MKTGVALLVGGKSRRMGIDKARLTFGENSFVTSIAKELKDFDERFLCVGNGASYDMKGFVSIWDKYLGCGPIAGLHAALQACSSEALLVVTCDMPLFQNQLGRYLVDCLNQEYQSVITMTRDGKLHPLCAIYRKETAEIIEQQIMCRQFSILDALKKMRVYQADLSQTTYSDTLLFNVNTPEDYIALCQDYGGK